MQQALLVKVFAGSASTEVVAASSVGKQIAIAAFTALVGLGAVVFVFRFRSFKEVIAAGRASREAEQRAERAGAPLEYYEPPTPEDDGPPGASTPRVRRSRYETPPYPRY